MEEFIYNCHLCEKDEISIGEKMDFSFIKNKKGGDWQAGRLSGLYY